MDGSPAFHSTSLSRRFIHTLNTITISYANSADAFLQQSSWDEYLAFHYTGQTFVPQDGQAFVPDQTIEIVAPAHLKITIAPIQLSDNFITSDEILTPEHHGHR
ncbi:MAG: hypothetical protein IPN96_06680 [Anaerolineales bacterium]|nr:hypothetical protein [Anaerolineales bacterium]